MTVYCNVSSDKVERQLIFNMEEVSMVKACIIKKTHNCITGLVSSWTYSYYVTWVKMAAATSAFIQHMKNSIPIKHILTVIIALIDYYRHIGYYNNNWGFLLCYKIPHGFISILTFLCIYWENVILSKRQRSTAKQTWLRTLYGLLRAREPTRAQFQELTEGCEYHFQLISCSASCLCGRVKNHTVCSHWIRDYTSFLSPSSLPLFS